MNRARAPRTQRTELSLDPSVIVLRESVGLVTLGTVLGAIAALGASRYLESLLFGLAPGDPLTYLSVARGLVLVALLASLIPARRAALVNPLIALRAE